jgi:hypothetical protein
VTRNNDNTLASEGDPQGNEHMNNEFIPDPDPEVQPQREPPDVPTIPNQGSQQDATPTNDQPMERRSRRRRPVIQRLMEVMAIQIMTVTINRVHGKIFCQAAIFPVDNAMDLQDPLPVCLQSTRRPRFDVTA